MSAISTIKKIWQSAKADIKEIENTPEFATAKQTILLDAKELGADLKPLAQDLLADLLKLL
jgi:hypothetical protein